MSAALLQRYAPQVEEALPHFLEDAGLPQRRVIEACRYSLLAGGKRLRPSLLLAFAEQCGGSARAAMPFACGLEMIHTYSLIHDDLPCMDDDDLRRGKPTCHRAFGEDMAVLAGDGLLNRAFEVMLAAETVPPERALRAAAYIARQSGVFGMVGGQTLDLSPEALDSEPLQNLMIDLKTGALLRAACAGGCILAGAAPERVAAAEEYAGALGMAFQIVDDLLDVLGDPAKLGKDVRHDADQGKKTFVARYGEEGCRGLIRNYTARAAAAAGAFPDPTPLQELALALSARDR